MSPSKYAAPGKHVMRTLRCLLLMALMLGGFSAHADTVTLKDGTVLEGDITAEDSATLSIYLEFSGGTITQTRQISKSEIARIVRWTPKQKAERQTTRDYEKLQKYQLSPQDSYEVEYYNQIINDVFRAFLTEHPVSPYTSNVTERIVEWKAERDLVAAGNVKFRGRWSPAAEVAPLIESARGHQLLQQAHTLISQHQFESAVKLLQLVVRMNGQPDLVSQAKPLLTSAYQSALGSLDQEQRQLGGDVISAQVRVDQARQVLTAAEAALAQSTNGNSQATADAQISVNRARAELNAAQSNVEFLKGQLEVVKQKLAAMKSQVTVVETSTSAPPAPKPQPAPPPPASQPDVITGLVAWVKNNWVAMGVIGAVILFLISRLLIKD